MSKRNTLEREVENILEQELSKLGYNYTVGDPEQDTFMQSPKTVEEVELLSGSRPDYTVYLEKNNDHPNIVIEVKKPNMTLKKTYDQALDYAHKLNAEIIVLYDGITSKSFWVKTEQPLMIENIEISQLLSKEEYLNFIKEDDSNLVSSKLEIVTKKDLIGVFSFANNKLRKSGIQKGIERFSEFSNLLFLKLISESSDIVKDAIPEYIKWDSYKNKSGDELLAYINDTVVPALEKIFNKQEQKSIFSKIQLNDTSSLKQIISKLDKLDLQSIKTDIKGDAFEYFIQKYNSSNKDLGEYFTPRHIVNFIVKLANIKYGEQVYDPFCGTGGMLISAFTQLLNSLEKQENIKITEAILSDIKERMFYGSEISSTAKIAKMNMILSGDGHSNILQQDTLKNPVSEKFDVIITNIPFNLEVDANNYYHTKGTKNGNNQCIEHIIKSLKKGSSSRSFVIVPEGFLNNSESLSTRKYIIDNNLLKGIISLPVGVFLPYADVKTSILILQGFNSPKRESVFYYKIKNDGYTLTTRRRRKEGVNDLDEFLSTPEKDMPQIPLDKIKQNVNYSLLYFKYDKTVPVGYEKLSKVLRRVSNKNIDGYTTATVTNSNFYGIASGEEYWGENFISVTSETNEDYNVLSRNMITYNPSRANVGSIGINIIDNSYAITSAYPIFEVFNDNFLPEYVYLYLKSREGHDEIVSRSFGSVRQSLSPDDFVEIGIPKVPIEEQGKICLFAKKLYKKHIKAQKELTLFALN